MKRMLSKERVRTTFARKQADRVPVNYIANPGIDARLKAHFACGADDNEGLLQALGVDFRSVNARYVGPKLHADVPDRNVDPILGYRTRYVEHATGGSGNSATSPWNTRTNRPWPSGP